MKRLRGVLRLFIRFLAAHVLAACVVRPVLRCACSYDTATCHRGGTTIFVPISAATRTAEFRCGFGVPRLEPSVESQHVFSSRECNTTVSLESQLPGASLVAAGRDGGPSYILKLKEWPTAEAPEAAYYQCAPLGTDGPTCKVMVGINRPTSQSSKKSNQPTAQLHQAGKAIPTCSESGTSVSVHVSSRTRRGYFRCGTELPLLDPPVSEELAYTTRSCRAAAPLAAQVPTMACAYNQPQNLYILTLKQLPAEEHKTVYYKCVDPGSSAACKVIVHVPPSAPDPQSPRAHLPSSTGVCTESGTTIRVDVSSRTKRAQFGCGGGMFLLDPPFLSGNLYTTRSCSKPMPLRTQVSGYLLMSPSGGSFYTLALKSLPVDRPRTLYYRCMSPGRGESCKIAINVPPDPTANQNVVQYRGVPVCSDNGSTIIAPVSPQTKTAQFKCGPAFFELYPPVASGKAYPSRACVTPAPLGDIVNGSLSESAGGHNLYTFRVDDLPARESKDVYFKCMAPDRSGSCKVHIKIPRRYSSAKPLEPPNIHVCYPGPDASLHIRTPAYSSFYVRCAAGLTHFPSEETEVYDNRDGACSTSVSLDRLVKGAELIRVPQVRSTGSTYLFSVERLPEEQNKLCYLCAPNSNLRTEACRILITVPSRNHSHGRALEPTTTPSSQASLKRIDSVSIMALLSMSVFTF
ncbi:SRS domain-containing protein [Neospora caninum Liverpool]|uniref:SRS domain-containing protein n=1 Tax=Neospora caninum (strain Liverpool) TaxID=572307 RepID=F0VJ25_NEOCL|nr:SRS domain-containing protein [Neospora caninum Liverpool]CBZ53736.1 SRS domain-containing protein [Neospora caninum Liverpool]CEL67725.1 TPA: SRS domain-containing protein [Neospora caninum Liverpool]|eukprot:XP_003883768.1 SRS domain-containing protein [Neospora caninum Liverpool]